MHTQMAICTLHIQVQDLHKETFNLRIKLSEMVPKAELHSAREKASVSFLQLHACMCVCMHVYVPMVFGAHVCVGAHSCVYACTCMCVNNRQCRKALLSCDVICNGALCFEV